MPDFQMVIRGAKDIVDTLVIKLMYNRFDRADKDMEYLVAAVHEGTSHLY